MQAPAETVGSSIICKRCGNSYTLAPIEETANNKAAPALGVQASASSGTTKVPPPGNVATKCPSSSPALPPATSEQGQALEDTVRQHSPLTKPVMPVVVSASAPPPPPPPDARWNPIGVTALLLASLGLLCASISWMQWAVIPFAGFAFLFGVFGLLADFHVKTEDTTPKLGLGVAVILLAVATLWPALLGMDTKVTADVPAPVDKDRQVFVPRTDRNIIAKPTPQPVEPGRWVEADLFDFDHGLVRLRVLSAGIQNVPAHLRRDQRKIEKELVVRLQLSHVGNKDALQFLGWRGDLEATAPRLQDGAGKRYAFRPRSEAKGPAARPLLPFSPLEETLAFDPPPADVDFLRLELPASAFGAAGSVRFQLSKSMITR